MSERWPAAMRLVTLAAYLDMSPSSARKIVDAGVIPAVQFNPRGDRYFLKEDADAFLDQIRNGHILSVREA